MRHNFTEAEYLAVLTKQAGGTAPRTAMTHWKDSPEATEQSPMRKVSGSTLNPRLPPPPYRSKLEAAFAQKLELERMGGEIANWWYEPVSFRLASGKRYRPDFMVIAGDGISFYEVKGKWMKNRRDGMTHLKWAAQLYPIFKWFLVQRDGCGWDSRKVDV